LRQADHDDVRRAHDDRDDRRRGARAAPSLVPFVLTAVQCPGCPYGGLDLSPGLFSFFASTDLGVLSGVWAFEADAPTHAKMTPAAAPTSTSRPHAHSQSHSRFLATVLASAEAAAPSPISILDGDDDDDGAEDGNVFDLVGDGGKLEWCDEGAEDVVEAEGAEGAEDAEDAEQA
jgi:hypothetical protein